MKIHCAIWSLGVLMTVSASQSFANFDGCDNFNDNSKDPTRWGANGTFGAGLLTEINQRLEYTTSGAPTANDRAWMPWILNTGNYSNSWDVQIDFNLPGFTLTNGQSVVWNLFVLDDNSTTNLLGISFYHDPAGQISLSLTTNGQRTDVAKVDTLSTSAAVRIAFDASTKVLAGYFDEDGQNCGYSWRLLGTSVVPTAWGMTSNSVFNVLVATSSANTAVASSNNMFADNFNAASGSFPPFQIQRTGGGVAISWPTNAPNFHLESTATLSPPICWDAVTNVPAVVSTNFIVTNAVSSQTRFFRLSRYGSACQ